MVYNKSMGFLENLEHAMGKSCSPHIISEIDENKCINCDAERGQCPECGSLAHGNWKKAKKYE